MALRITPGPLPEDGERFRIEEMLTDFVQGTQITGFGAGEFTGSANVNMVISSTNPPATDARNRGTLWFARGTGRLFQWTIHPHPTHAGVQSATNASWVSLSDKREVLVRYLNPVVAGQVLRPNTENSHANDSPGFALDLALDGRYTMIVSATTPTNAAPPTRANPAFLVDPIFIATESGDTGDYKPAVEMGFCSCFVKGEGAQNNEPRFGYHIGDVSFTDHQSLKASTQSAWTNTVARIAMMSTSQVSLANRLLTVLKMPSLTSLVKPIGNPFSLLLGLFFGAM